MNTLLTWQIERLSIELQQKQLQKLLDLAGLISNAQDQHNNLVAYSNSQVGEWFPELKRKAIQEAEVKKQVSIRLRKYFNNIANEIQL